MNRLEDLEKELYGADADKLNKRLKKRATNPETPDNVSTSWVSQKPAKKPARKKLVLTQSAKKIILGGFAVLVMALGATVLFYYLSSGGQEAKIKIETTADQIESGRPVSLSFVFHNSSDSALKEVELSVALPKDSKILEEGSTEKTSPPRYTKTLDDLVPGEDRKIELVVRMFGKEGEDKMVEAILSYRPANLRARFSAKQSKILTINHVPLAISWEAPQGLSSGQDVEMKINYLSDSDQTFDNLVMQVDYPEEFSYSSADPKPDIGNNIWKLGSLDTGENGSIRFRGKLSGGQGEAKVFKARLGIYNEAKKEMTAYSESPQEVSIATSPLSIEARVNEARQYIVSPEETLSLVLRYRNNSDISLSNVTIKSYLESGPTPSSSEEDFQPGSGRNMLDLSTVDISNEGVFDSQNQAVVWSPANSENLKEIKPGEEGQVSFRIRTRDSFLIRSNLDRNLVLRFRTTIESPDTPEEFRGTHIKYEDRFDLKSKSKVSFSAKPLYNSFVIANSGPLPPKVGAKTTYTILWEVRNFSNDLQGAEIRATIPPNVNWENVIFPVSSRITFNKSSGEVVWAMGSLSAGTGVLNQVLSGAFQVSVVPSEVDAGRAITLLNKSTFTATDSFTKQGIEYTVGSLSTELKEDSSTSIEDWRVVK